MKTPTTPSRARMLVALSGLALAAVAFAWLRSARGGRTTSGAGEGTAYLALLEPHAGGCVLTAARLPEGITREVAILPSDCAGGQLAFDPTGEKAVVWFSLGEADPRDLSLFEIELDRRRARRLTPPEGGDPETFAYDAGGRLHAFLVDQEVEILEEGDTHVVVRGARRFPARPGSDGLDAVAVAMALREGRWTEIEASGTRCCAETAPGTDVLETLAAIVRDPATGSLLSAPATSRRTTPPVLHDPILLRQLAREAGPAREDEAPGADAWPFLRYAQRGWSASLIAPADGLPARFATGPLYFERGRVIARIPPDAGGVFGAEDRLEVHASGRYVVVAEARTGMRPVAFDMREGKLAFENRLAFAARFWPEKSLSPWR